MKKKILILTSLLCASALSFTACSTKPSNTTPSEATSEASSETGSEATTEVKPDTEAPSTGTETSSETASGDVDGVVRISEKYKLEPGTEVTVGSDTFKYYEEYSDEYENDGEAYLAYNDQVFDLGDTEWIADSYVTKMTDGSYYIFATFQYDNDYRATKLVMLRDGKLTEGSNCPNYNGYVQSTDAISDDSVDIAERMDVMGTYEVTNDFNYRDGDITPRDSTYDIVSGVVDETGHFLDNMDDDFGKKVYDKYGARILTVKTAFDANDKDNASVTIPAEAVIYPTTIDIEKNLFFFNYNEQTYSVEYEGDASYNRTVNGVLEEDLFYVLPYAG